MVLPMRGVQLTQIREEISPENFMYMSIIFHSYLVKACVGKAAGAPQVLPKNIGIHLRGGGEVQGLLAFLSQSM